ncbi:MAG: EAL domain-containing protein [Burkholderiales bacterium]|nr:EAL domain-containing protein [Burkholderiales bacterium]
MESDADIEEIKRLRAALDVARLRLLNLGQSEEAVAQDIAEMEQRLRSERLFAVAFQESPEALVLSRLSDGLLVDVNQEWLNLTGYTREEAVGHTVVELHHWIDAQTRQKALTPLITQGRLRGLEATVFLKDGAPCLVRLSGSVIDVFDEKLILMRVKDITAERMAEEALRAGEMALERANEQLSAQLELYEFTERLAHVGHWTASTDGQTIHWSDGLLKLADINRSPDMSIQESRSYTHPDDLPAFLAARQRMDGEVFEYRWCHPDGRVFWLRTRMHRKFRRDGSSTDFGVVLDVTHEHQTRQALQERLDFIQKITSRIPDMVFQMCTRANGRMTFPFASDALFRMFQIRPEDAREDASFVFAFIHPDDLPSVRASMKSAAVDGGTWQHEFRVRFKDGSERWLLGNAVVHIEGEGDIMSYGALTDITERKKSEMQLQESEARFRSLTDLSSDWYWEIDEQFRFTRFDGYRLGKSTTTAQDSIGRTRWDIGAVNMTEEDWAAHRRVLAAHQQFKDLELQRRDADGQSYWISISGTPMFDAQGRFRGYRGIGRDISKRKHAEDETQRLAFYDTLTGLPNRRLLMDRLTQTMAISARNHHHCALLFIDLDNFKDLNDSLGHDVGDQLLEQVADRLVGCIREGDTAARFGGDEFVVMLEGLSEESSEAASQVEIVAEKILASLNQPYELMGKQHSSTPSIGIALFSGHEPGADELLKRADVAMYQAKAAGRNTLRFYDPEMQAAVMARAALDADLRQGLQRQELLLHYQPVVDVQGRTTGFEALVRWQHPQRGLVGPGEFIDLAEQTGLILPIGQWVLQAACRQLVAWEGQAATQGLTLSVNVSARQFRRSDFVAQVLAVLHDCGADPQLLKLELTESVLLSDVEDAIRKMSALRSCGVRFALDDFGTGYSSLAYLKRLPLDQLKIDQTFVRDVLEDANDAAIVRTILALAHSMDLMAVAEGVETEGQRQFLLDNGCTLFQGYLFSRPVPIEAITLPA